MIEKGAERGHSCPPLYLRGFAANWMKRRRVSALRSAQSASLPKHKTRLQTRFRRILANVSLHGAEVLGTADEAVKVIGLPEGIQGAEAGFVDETARYAFPAFERVGEGFAVAEREEDVDVIGHNDVAPEVVALAVEVMEAVGDDLGEAWITQGAGAVRGLEVFVELVGELAVEAGFGDFVPRRRIGGEEGLASAKPVIEEFTRKRIGEAEGDEDRHLALLPVRQLVGRLFDVPSRIEELHCSVNRGERGHCLTSFALRAACGWLSPLRSGSCPLFEMAAKPRREGADRSVRAPLQCSTKSTLLLPHAGVCKKI